MFKQQYRMEVYLTRLENDHIQTRLNQPKPIEHVQNDKTRATRMVRSLS